MGQFATIKKYIILFCLSCAISSQFKPPVIAQIEATPEATPEATQESTPEATLKATLEATLEAMEAAANQQNLEKLMQFYSEEFSNNDGLRYESVAEAISSLWSQYPQANYEITLDSWEKQGEQLVANTTTKIEGSNSANGRTETINSTIRSRQYFEAGKLVRQEIISEATDITSGNPPEVKVKVPEKVQTRDQFNFDVIVEEPLKSGILLGGAIEEQTGSDRYLEPSKFELEALPSGGVFKLVTAPGLPGSYWLSAIIIEGDGMITVTRRVTVEDN